MTISLSEVKDKPEKETKIQKNADNGHWKGVGIFSMGTTSIAIVQ